MSSVFPIRFEVEPAERSLHVVRMNEPAADDVFSVLSTGTARALLAEVYRDPAPLSDLADRTDMSVQNATYHINRLVEIELVEVIGKWYSARGKEMDVYAPTSDPLVLVAGLVDGDTDGPR